MKNDVISSTTHLLEVIDNKFKKINNNSLKNYHYIFNS